MVFVELARTASRRTIFVLNYMFFTPLLLKVRTKSCLTVEQADKFITFDVKNRTIQLLIITYYIKQGVQN